MASDKKNGWTKFIVWFAGGLIAAGGLAYAVKSNTETLSRHDTRISGCERTGAIVETKLESIGRDLAWIRRKLDKMEP
jgi:hypothetical protein